MMRIECSKSESHPPLTLLERVPEAGCAGKNIENRPACTPTHDTRMTFACCGFTVGVPPR